MFAIRPPDKCNPLHVAVQHTDTAYAHVHVQVNLVSIEDGTTPKLSYSKKKLRQWANKFEEQHGLQITEGSRKNAEKRAQGEKVDARRKPRNVYEQEAREGVERRTAWMRKLHNDKKRELQERTQNMKAQHAKDWNLMLTEHRARVAEIYKRRDDEIEQELAALKLENKPLWRDMFKQNRADIAEFEASDKSAILKPINIAKAYTRSRKEGDSRFKSAMGAIIRSNRRAYVEMDNEERKKALARRVGLQKRNLKKKIGLKYKEEVKRQWAVLNQKKRHLDSIQKMEVKQQRGLWKKYHAERRKAQAVVASENLNMERSIKQNRNYGEGYHEGYEPD